MKTDKEIEKQLNSFLWSNLDSNMTDPERPMKATLHEDLKSLIRDIRKAD